MGCPARSRARGRRMLHERYAGGRARLDRGLPVAGDVTGPQRQAAVLGAPAMAVALPLAPPRAVQPTRPLAPQRGAPLRSRQTSLRAVPRCGPAVQLRLFRASGAVARRRPAGQEAAYRGEAAAADG